MKLALGLLGLLSAIVALHTFDRAVLMHHHRTDIGAYLRAGWAVKTGADPYAVLDDRGWHYIYPPALAILCTPLALPPGGVSAGAGLAYPLSVILWFALSLASCAFGLHDLASAIEANTSVPALRAPPRFGRRWWLLRIVPFAVAGFGIGNTLERGQVTLFLLGAVCAMTAALIRGREARAGGWLAVAATLKIYPIYLIAPLLLARRMRALWGAAAMLAAGGLILPLIAMGPERTLHAYASLTRLVLTPAFAGAHRTDRMDYLDDVDGNISSFKVALFHLAYPAANLHPRIIPWPFEGLHYLLCLTVTGATLLAGRTALKRGANQERPGDAVGVALLTGALTVALLPMIPLSRDHYFALAAPLVMALTAHVWESRGEARLGPGWVLLFVVVAVGSIMWELPGLAALKAYQPVVYDEMLLWAAGVYVLDRRLVARSDAAAIIRDACRPAPAPDPERSRPVRASGMSPPSDAPRPR